MNRFEQKNFLKENKVLFATNGDIYPNSPLLDSIDLYKELTEDNIFCVPGKNIKNNIPIFGLEAFFIIIQHALRFNYNYVIYIDADCFIWSLDNLFRKFQEFAASNCIFCGVPDGGIFCHRNTNNYCINPFLSFFNINRIKKAHIQQNQLILANPSISNISDANKYHNRIVLDDCKQYRDKFQKTVPYMQTTNFLKTNTVETAYTYDFTIMTEYYYKLFLGLLTQDECAMYIHGRDYVCEADKFGLTSGLYINKNMQSDLNLICLHTWFSRVLINPECQDKVLNPRDDISQGLCHQKRIKDVMNFVKENHIN